MRKLPLSIVAPPLCSVPSTSKLWWSRVLTTLVSCSGTHRHIDRWSMILIHITCDRKASMLKLRCSQVLSVGGQLFAVDHHVALYYHCYYWFSSLAFSALMHHRLQSIGPDAGNSMVSSDTSSPHRPTWEIRFQAVSVKDRSTVTTLEI